MPPGAWLRPGRAARGGKLKVRPGLILAATALLAACAGSPLKTKAPDGLSFTCDGGAPLSVVFNDHGYLPDSSALGRDREGALSQRPRSMAVITHAGASHAMVAEWAELGLRYRATAAGPDGRHLILSLRGEDAVLGWRAEIPAVGTDPAGEQIAACRRAGRAPSYGTGDTHRP